MKIKFITILLTAAALMATGCEKEDLGIVSFEKIGEMSPGRASAAAAVCGDAVYIYGGRSASAGFLGDFWKYTPSDNEDVWEELPTPKEMKARTGAVAIEADGKIYLGLGFNGVVYDEPSYLRDWWCYDPKGEKTGEGNEGAGSPMWERLEDYPSEFSANAVAFEEDGKIYVCFGYLRNRNKHIYVFDTAARKWSSIYTGIIGTTESVTGAVGRRHFVGNNEDWYEFDTEAGKLEERKPYRKGGGRMSSSMLSDGRYLYMFGGRDWYGVSSKDDVLRYDTDADEWMVCGKMPGASGMENAVSFTVGGKSYIGLGETDRKITGNIYRVFYKD